MRLTLVLLCLVGASLGEKGAPESEIQGPVAPVAPENLRPKHQAESESTSALPANPKDEKVIEESVNKQDTNGQRANHKDYDDTKVGPDVAHMVQDARELADSSLGFWHAFVASVSVIIVSELGDKTWFIAAIMAMRHSRSTVFLGAIAALSLMTVLSACLGWATQIIPRKVTYYVSTALFALFGLKMLREGWVMSPNEGQEEYEEAQAEVKKTEEKLSKEEESMGNDIETGIAGVVRPRRTRQFLNRFVSKIFLEAFTLTFLAEWGDRSQITTIILAARENVGGVAIGGSIGHAVCTGIAVLGGRIVAQRISVRTVTLIGGVVFILFALSALILNPE